ncbi:MAG: hypothetical protein HLUCCO07_11400 [Rhodobacteraceae bacterium HLUCCO07]|nr:MAG: hypothetical protein HLUCCO07_11400 [Rhodobacteraceae bacterium HLUCCO07]
MLSIYFAALPAFIPGAGHEVTGRIDIANPAPSCGGAGNRPEASGVRQSGWPSKSAPWQAAH